jgi:CubicO group peptidase (beta-lactamase class C family)
VLRFVCSLAACCLLWSGPAFAEADPVFSAAGPDAAAYGQAEGYPTAPPSPLLAQRFMVGNFSHFDRLFAAHTVEKSASPWQFRRAARELSLTYYFRGAGYSLSDYLARNPVTGLLIAHNDTIVFEHYQYGRTDHDRFLSQSMAKTITAMLLGIAVSEGKIRSIDDPAATYVPALANTEFGLTSIRDLLHMASGIAFSEDYGGHDDSAGFGRALFAWSSPGPAAVIARYNTRVEPPGTHFHYAGIDTEVLGLIVANATHMSLAAYLQSRIWQPMGAEADATWVVDHSDTEPAFCCFNATLRDWARLGMLLANYGALNGRQIISRDWVVAATSVAANWLAAGTATPGSGYGYQVWLLPGQGHDFALLGIHGQAVFVDPAAKLVMVNTAVRLKPANDPGVAESYALWRALVQRFSH